MKQLYNQLDYKWEEQEYEKNVQPSQTIPDQTMSIREIIDRFANGGVIEQFTPYYGEEEDFNEMLPDITKMDLADRQSYVEQFKEELAFMQEQTKTDVTTQEGEQV
jgi:hypothetical protein